MTKLKDVFTTGDVARICHVAPRTVSKWFDAGHLRGYRIPGSKDRRIPRNQLIRFMKAYGIPLDRLEAGFIRVLLIDADAATADMIAEALTRLGTYEVSRASTAIEAGARAEAVRPDVIVADVSMPDVSAKDLCRFARSHPDLQGVTLIATSGALTEGKGQALLEDGFDKVLKKPFELRQLIEMIEQLSAE